MKNYKLTLNACYLGTVSQTVVINLTAILFTALGEQFNLSYTQLGALVFINFITQVAVALIFGAVVDRYGFRRFIVGAHIAAAVGLGWFAATPLLPFPPYAMLVMGTFIFAVAGGFFELLISPIVNSIPTIPVDKKSSAMSIVHAFFCFGHVAVALFTTLLLFVFGREAWPIATLFWLLIPLGNSVLFAICPLAPPIPQKRQSPARGIIRQPLFILLAFTIAFSGASEIAFSQWISTFLEQIVELPKVVGDIAGVGLFATMMGISRIGYGILRQRGTPWLPSQSRLMLMGSALAILSYIMMAGAFHPALGLLACAICGLGVGLLWPGVLSLSVKTYPMAGTWMFAIMASAGNIGSAAGPSVFGVIADHLSLRAGYLLMAVLPLSALVCIMMFRRMTARGSGGVI